MQITSLKKQLPRGWVKLLAEKAQVSTVTVSDTMNGRANNSNVIDAAIELAAEHQKEEKKRLKKLEKLVA